MNHWPTFHRPDYNCPACSTLLDAATAIRHDCQPLPGDFTVCINCGEILRFEELGFRRIQSFELNLLAGDQIADLLTVQRAVRKERRRKRKP